MGKQTVTRKKIKKMRSLRSKVQISLSGNIVYGFLACARNKDYIDGVDFVNSSFVRVLKYWDWI